MNIELARKVLDHIERHPEEHNQGAFVQKTLCGTTCCIAGHTMLLSGRYTLSLGGWSFLDENGPAVYGATAEVARDLLEMPDNDAWAVFFNFNDEKAIDRFRDLILTAEKEQALNEGIE